MPSTLSDLVVEYPNAVPDELCDRLIRKFEEHPHLQHPAQTGSRLNQQDTVKVSTDLYITNKPEFEKEDLELTDILGKYLGEYHGFMSMLSVTYNDAATIVDKGFQIQRTTADGHYRWHTDEYVNALENSISRVVSNGETISMSVTERRMYTYIFYLNDQGKDFNGGMTEFRVGPTEVMEVKPEKGKLIMFPANALCTHQGTDVTDGEKYLATGWVCDIIFSVMGDTRLYTDDIKRKFEAYLQDVND